MAGHLCKNQMRSVILVIMCILQLKPQLSPVNAHGIGLLRTYIKELHNGSETNLIVQKQKKCEPVTLPLCIDKIHYKYTSMPNAMGHDSQEQAKLYIYPFSLLNCYEYLLQFVCSVYLPMCVKDMDNPIPPCRSFCEAARRGCEQIINQVGLVWPDIMNCHLFPEYSPPSTICILPFAPKDKNIIVAAPTKKPPKGPKESKLAKTSNICSGRERRASIVYGHTFTCAAEILRKKGKVRRQKLEGLKHPVTLSSKDKYVIKTLASKAEKSGGKIVKLVSLCVRVKGAKKITTTFTASERVIARTVMRITSGNTTNWNNACLCNNMALYVDKITIQLKSLSGLPQRLGKIRNIEALVCERTHHFMHTLNGL